MLSYFDVLNDIDGVITEYVINLILFVGRCGSIRGSGKAHSSETNRQLG